MNWVLTVVFLISFAFVHDANAQNWNNSGAKLGKNSRIPEGSSPTLEQMRLAFNNYFKSDSFRPRIMISASDIPLPVQFDVQNDDYLEKQMNNTGLLSYILVENGVVVRDMISPNDRMGDLVTNETVLNSQSVGKSFVSYLMGHAICDGYISGIDQKISDWSLFSDTFYQDISIKDLINMNVGDSKYADRSRIKFKNPDRKKNVNNRPMAYWSSSLKGTKRSKSSFGSQFNYNGFLSNLAHNYIRYKSGNEYQNLLKRVYQEKIRIGHGVSFIKVDNASTAHGESDLKSGTMRSTMFATRYDYLRIAMAMLDDWQTDTCVGKYLKEIYANKVRRQTKGKSPFSSAAGYAGFFHTDFNGVKGTVFGMNGYGGQNVFINFDTGTIVVAHAVHQDYNWRKLVFDAVSTN